MRRASTPGARAPWSAAIALTAGALALAPAAAHATTETYTFHDTLAPVEGAGNAMVPVYNGTGAVLTSGATGFVNGSFVTQTISASACASTPVVRSWSFPARGGLRYPNSSPAVVTGSYTVSILVRFNPLAGAWARLIDFSNSTLDTGIYEHNGGVGFYPVGDYAAGSFVSGRDTFVTITRDGTSRVVNLFINGTAAGTYTDTGNLYAPAASLLYLFMDNTTGAASITEANAGVVSYIQISDAPMSAAQVSASLASICGAIACGDGVLESGEGCDSGSGAGSASCTAACRVPTGRPCNATAPGLVGDASCATGLCDAVHHAAPGQCAQCTSNAQCAGATPVCNTSTNLCVPCNAAGASACNAGSVCYTTGAMAGRCGPCTADAQCAGATPACDSATGACVACTASNASACAGATPVCQTATNSCAPCTAPGATGCAAGATCSSSGPTAGRCVQCTTNAQCSGATPVCDPSAGTCRACAVATQGTDCPGSPASACNGATGACVAPALTLSTPASGAAVPSAMPAFAGTATPGQVVTILVDGASLGTATASATGAWSLPWPPGRPALANGAHGASATITTGAGPVTVTNPFTAGCNASSDCGGATPVCDTATQRCVQCASSASCAGATPVCNAVSHTCRACAVATQSTDCPAAAASACNGATGACVAPTVTLVAPATGSAIPTGSPTLRGTGTPGQSVDLSVDAMSLGTALTDAAGAWSLAWPTGRAALANGAHSALAAISAGSTSVTATSNFTVGCGSNADCSGTTPVCVTATNTCRACGPAGMASAECTSSAAPFCSATGATAGSCVATPPRITAPAEGSRVAETRPTIRGTAPASATVQVQIDGAVAGTARADATGSFSYAPASPLALGTHTVAAAVIAGTVAGPTGAANSFTVITCAASAECAGYTPVCDAASHTCRGCAAGAASECAGATPVCSTSGASAGMCVASVPTLGAPAPGSSTAVRRPEFRGMGAPGTTVAILIDGVEVGRATVDAMGNFVFTPSADLAVGEHTVAVAPVIPGGGDAGSDAGALGAPGPAVSFTIAPCTRDSECGGATPVCDAATGNCRACDPASAVFDCPDPSFPMCSTSGSTRGRCVEDAPVVVTPADGSTTAQRRPAIVGFAAPSSPVAVQIDGAEVGRATSDFTGMWRLALTRDLAPGAHTIDASYLQPDGSLGAPGGANAFTVVECAGDSDCAAGLRCDPGTNRCVGDIADAGTDAGTPADDAGTPADDASAPADDAAPEGSVNTPPPAGTGACGCRTAGNARGSSLGALGLALALALARLRRRRG